MICVRKDRLQNDATNISVYLLTGQPININTRWSFIGNASLFQAYSSTSSVALRFVLLLLFYHFVELHTKLFSAAAVVVLYLHKHSLAVCRCLGCLLVVCYVLPVVRFGRAASHRCQLVSPTLWWLCLLLLWNLRDGDGAMFARVSSSRWCCDVWHTLIWWLQLMLLYGILCRCVMWKRHQNNTNTQRTQTECSNGVGKRFWVVAGL